MMEVRVNESNKTFILDEFRDLNSLETAISKYIVSIADPSLSFYFNVNESGLIRLLHWFLADSLISEINDRPVRSKHGIIKLTNSLKVDVTLSM